MMIYACIKDGVIKNIIVVEDLSFLQMIVSDWEYLKRIDNLSPTPQIGWLYNPINNSYTPPEE